MTEPEMNALYPGRGFAGTPRVPTDAERLDWLGRTMAKVGRTGPAPGATEPYFVAFEGDGPAARHYRFGPTLRDAIDAGMAVTGDTTREEPTRWRATRR